MLKNLRLIQNLSVQFGKNFSKQSVSTCACQRYNENSTLIPNQRIATSHQGKFFLATRGFHQTKYLQSTYQPGDVEPPKEKQPKKAGQLAKVFAEYGTTAVVFHTTISLTSLGICYTAVSRY